MFAGVHWFGVDLCGHVVLCCMIHTLGDICWTKIEVSLVMIKLVTRFPNLFLKTFEH